MERAVRRQFAGGANANAARLACMENSGNIRSGGDENAGWIVAIGEAWVGPLTVSEIFEKLDLGEITWAHFAWKEGEPGWRRLSDIESFQTGVPKAPSQDLLEQVKEITRNPAKQTPPPPPQQVERNWFLYYNDTQFGPFSREEMGRYIAIGKIHGKVHAWKDGMENWERLESIREFASDLAEAAAKNREIKSAARKPPARLEVREQRDAPRRPLVAKIFLTSEETVITGVCRDISVGGMQVLTDFVPGKPGTRVKMNVSPSSGELGGHIEPFVAEGVVVRILEDGRGFSFRFEKLPPSARKAIEDYIASQD